MALVSYLRVSTKEQTIENQRSEILKRGYIPEEEFVDEGFTGMNTDREGFIQMMRFVRKGDTLIVYSLSRLARSTKQLLEVMEKLQEKGVSLISISESVDTSSAVGRMIIGILAVVNQFEVENMKERQSIGIARAKEEGKFKGRKVIDKPSTWNEVYSRWKSRDLSGTGAIKELGVSRATFYKWIKEHKEEIRKSEVQKHGELPEKSLFASEGEK